MKKILGLTSCILSFVAPAYAANVLPTVTTFTVPPSAVSPIPVSALTATDSDGTVTGYIITESSTKPLATATGWSATKPVSYATTKSGTVTLYAWAKDNAGGVSAAKTASTTLLGGHTHYMSDVVGLTAALNAKANISDLTILQKKYANVITVAKSGGDFDDPIAAMNSISTASETSPFLLKIMPGVYNLGSSRLYMKEYVDIEGAGENATIITSNSSTTWFGLGFGTITGANNAELRFLTVKNTGFDPAQVLYFCAIGNTATSPKITHVTAKSEGAGYYNNGICNNGASAIITDVKIVATAVQGGSSAYGILDHDSKTTLRNVDIEATGGLVNLGVAVDGTNSQGITMNNVNITVTGGSGAYGISSVVPTFMSNTTVTASEGQSTTIAIDILSAKPATMTNVNVVAKSSQGSNLAIKANCQPLTIERSSIDGDIVNEGNPLRLAASKLNGTITGSSNTCVASYDGNFAPLSATCQ